jgi:hypothetical protein
VLIKLWLFLFVAQPKKLFLGWLKEAISVWSSSGIRKINTCFQFRNFVFFIKPKTYQPPLYLKCMGRSNIFDKCHICPPARSISKPTQRILIRFSNQTTKLVKNHLLFVFFFPMALPTLTGPLASSVITFYTDGRTPKTEDQPVARPLLIHRT